MKVFFLIVALIMSDGSLDLYVEPVAKCPDKGQFTAFMEAQKEAGKFRDWNAQCAATTTEGQGA